MPKLLPSNSEIPYFVLAISFLVLLILSAIAIVKDLSNKLKSDICLKIVITKGSLEPYMLFLTLASLFFIDFFNFILGLTDLNANTQASLSLFVLIMVIYLSFASTWFGNKIRGIYNKFRDKEEVHKS